MVPSSQQFRIDQSGRRRYIDAVWDLPDGDRLVLEVDGALHMQVSSWWKDLERERAVVLSVGRVLRCSATELRLHPDTIVANLVRAGVPRRS